MRRIEPERFAWLGLLLAVVFGAIALYVGPTNDGATGFAGAAVFGAFLYATLRLWPRTLVPPVRPALPEGSKLVSLRDAFRSGPFGRQTVIATIETLDRQLGTNVPPISPAEAHRAATELSHSEFREWVSERVGELERAS